MRTLICSDIHGNLIAFEKMLKAEPSIDQFVCLGDLINYGPWSNECVDLANSLNNSIILLGNHEELILSNSNFEFTSELLKLFVKSSLKNFQRKDAIKNFHETYLFEDFICLHTIEDKYIYPDTKIKLDSNYLIGHSHYQFKYSYEGNVLINPGSVGQNREFINLIDYVIYDSDKGEIEFKRIKYDISPLINEMKIRKYDNKCISYYLSKNMF